MKKKRICSRADMTDQQARDQVNLSEYAADIIKQTETDYGKKLSTAGWGKIMDYLEDMIYDTKKSLSDSERKIKIEDYIYQIYESDTGIKDVYTSSRVTCSVDLSAQNYASIVMKDPVKVSIGGNDDEIVSAIMEMNKDDLGKLYNSVIRKYFKMTQGSSYQAGRKSRLWEKSTPHMSERDLIDTLVYFVQEGAIVPTKKASNIKGGTSIMRKKRFSVKASMSAKRRNTVSASRMRSVRCARTSGEVDNVAVRELVLYITNDAKLYPNVLSIIENMKRKVKRGQYNDDLAIKAWQYLADDGVRKYDKEFGSNNGSVSMLNPATRKEIAKQLRDYYKDQVFEDVEASKSVRCSRTMRRPIKASESDRKRYNVVLSRDEANELKDFLRKNRIKFDSSGYGVNTYITFDLTKRESDMVTDFLDAMVDHATIDVEEYFDRLPEVNSAKSIECARTMRKHICAASAVHKEAYSDLYNYAEKNRLTTRWTADVVKDYVERIKRMYGLDDSRLDATLKKVNQDFKRKNKVKSFPYSEDILSSAITVSTKRRFAVKASVGDSVDVDEIKQILRDAGVKTWGVKKSSYHGGDLIEIVFDDTNDYSKATFAIEDAGFDVKFDSSNGANVYRFIISDNREAEAYLYRVVFEYNNEVVPMDDETSDYQAVLDACIDKMESEGNTGYLYTYDEAYDYAKDLADDEADVERIMEEEFVEGGNHGLYLLTAGNFNIIPIGFGKASEYVGSAVNCSKSIRGRKRVCAASDGGVLIKTDSKEGTYYLTKSSTKQKTFWSASIGNANRFAKKDSALNKLYAVLRKLPENAFYDEDSIFDIEDESDLNNSEFAKFYLTDMSGNVVEDISTEVKRHLLSDEDFVDAALEDDFDDDIESAKSIKCAAWSKDNSVDPIDSEFMIDLYYSPNHSGRAGDRYFYNWSEAESYAHDALMHGLYVSIWNKNNGDILDISPEEYHEAWDNGAADFDINEDIVNFKRRIVESAKSIKCDDEIEDEITEGDSDLTIDISQLELSEPYYETREDDPENPDKWVLVIGKNPERHMNYKLWYYVDSTDADLTGLDLSNPDHIDIDEESTFEDYDDIQLSSDVSCCGDGRYSAGLVTM